MTTRDFIERQFGVADGVERVCSSVFKDGQGYIYSYGRHYVLLFQAGGLNFINVSGYSSTTAKHIAWAKQAVDSWAIAVCLDDNESHLIARNWTTDDEKLETVAAALKRQRDAIAKTMDAKKRRDTKLYRDLESEYRRLDNSYWQVMRTMNQTLVPITK